MPPKAPTRNVSATLEKKSSSGAWKTVCIVGGVGIVALVGVAVLVTAIIVVKDLKTVDKTEKKENGYQATVDIETITPKDFDIQKASAPAPAPAPVPGRAPDLETEVSSAITKPAKVTTTEPPSSEESLPEKAEVSSTITKPSNVTTTEPPSSEESPPSKAETASNTTKSANVTTTEPPSSEESPPPKAETASNTTKSANVTTTEPPSSKESPPPKAETTSNTTKSANVTTTEPSPSEESPPPKAETTSNTTKSANVTTTEPPSSEESPPPNSETVSNTTKSANVTTTKPPPSEESTPPKAETNTTTTKPANVTTTEAQPSAPTKNFSLQEPKPEPKPIPNPLEPSKLDRDTVLPAAPCSSEKHENDPFANNLSLTGQFALSSDWPSYALMSYTLQEPDGVVCREYFPICGSSLIHPQFALTAAHCIAVQSTLVYMYDNPGKMGLECVQQQIEVRSKFKLRYFLHTGPVMVENNRIVNIDDHNVQTREITRNFTHPHYAVTEESMFHDLEIVKVEPAFTMNKYACTVNLVQDLKKTAPLYEKCVIVGFGMEHGHVSPHAKQISQGIVTVNQCDFLQYARAGQIRKKKDEICVGGKKEAICKGDRGGLLMCPKPDDVNGFVQVGLVGHIVEDKECTGTDVMQVFTRISPYLDWIIKTVHNG